MDRIFNAKVSVDPDPVSSHWKVKFGLWLGRGRFGDFSYECLNNLLEIACSWVPKSCPWQTLTRAFSKYVLGRALEALTPAWCASFLHFHAVLA